ncbi:MAG: pyrroline-5-carboxylate reductase [Bacteriovoracia bacterium]
MGTSITTNLGILGIGKMGEALVGGLQQTPGFEKTWKMMASRRSEEAARAVSQKLGIPVVTDNRELVKKNRIVILSVKPHHAQAVLESVAKDFTSDHVLVSICASVRISQMKKWSGGKPHLIRCMPNTPCLIGEGMTAISTAGGKDSVSDVKRVEQIFRTVGKTVLVEESLMDGVTGLSGCGPAYVYLVVEALSEAGVKVGLPRQTATLLAAQTLAGAAKMVLERGEHPAALKDEVTTPAGCTIDGLMALEEGKLRVTLIKAVLAAAKRSASLSE